MVSAYLFILKYFAKALILRVRSMADEDGPEIADSFYRHLFQGNDKSASHIPEVTQAAPALHEAVEKLRREGCSFERWVPFIHLGL